MQPFADHLLVHRRRDAAGEVEEVDGAVEVADTRHHLEFVATEEWQPPRAVRIVVGVPAPQLVGDRPRGDCADIGRILQDLLHPRVRIERLALDDTDGGEKPQRGRIDPPAWLLLNDIVQESPIRIVGRKYEIGGHT